MSNFVLGDYNDAVPMRVSSSKSYTLDELEQLARECVEEIQGGTTEQIAISILLTWLHKREREVGDEAV